jgi:hypothetical protein
VQPLVSQHRIIDGKYQIVRQLGEGGMGAVYEARHTGTARRVAVKVIVGEALAKNPDIVRRFRREAMASGSIESQHIAQVLDTGVDPTTGSPYMVMELLSGEDVQQAIQRIGGPLSPDLALRITAQACLGLQRAHEAGVVHRDIKPANLFLSRREGGELVVKLLDFGIAKVKMDQFSSTEHAHLTRTGAMLGTPLYMSPEQARGKKTIDHRTDIWSIGVVLYEALTARLPHGHAETLGELIIHICSQAPTPVQDCAPWIAPEVAAIVHRALALDPASRFASAGEMFEALRILLPDGHAIQEKTLAPVDAQVRALVAPRYVIALEGHVAASSGAQAPISGENGNAIQSGTGAGLAHSQAKEPQRSKAPLVAALAALVTVGAVGGGAAFLRNRVAARSGVAVAPAEAPASIALSVAPPAPTPPATAPLRSVHLGVAPATARVEVDGREVVQSDGSVVIEGALGSTHHVRVWTGHRETSSEVAITEDGTIPPKIDLGSEATGAPRTARPSVPAGAGNRASTSPATTQSSAAAKPTPPPPPTAPTVQRDFN